MTQSPEQGLPQPGSKREELKDWQRFLRAESHVLRKYPYLLVQQAANQPDQAAPSRAAALRLKSTRAPWLRWLNKHHHNDPCLLTIQSPSPSEADQASGAGYSLGNRLLICEVSPDARLIVSAFQSGTLCVWDADSGSAIAELRGHSTPVKSCRFSADGRRLMSQSSGSIRLWDLRSFQEIRNLGTYTLFLFSPDSRTVLTASSEVAKLWDAETGREIASMESFFFLMEPVFAYSADGRRIAGSEMFFASVWELGPWWEQPYPARFEPERLGSVQRTERVRSISLSPDGRLVAAGWDDNLVTVANAESDDILVTLSDHKKPVLTCAFSPDGGELASGSIDFTTTLWSTESWQPNAVLRGHSHYVEACAYAAHGDVLISGSADGVIRVWDRRQTGAAPGYQPHSRPVRACAYSPDGGRLVTASTDKTLKIWDSGTGDLVTTLSGHADALLEVVRSMGVDIYSRAAGEYAGQVLCCAYSPDGDWIAAGAKESLYLWEVSAEDPQPLSGHTNDVNTCAFSPDGRRLASGSDDGTLRVVDLGTMREAACLSVDSNGISGCAFSPDGARLLALSQTRVARIWDTVRWEEVGTLQMGAELDQGTAWVGGKGCAYSSDGRLILLGRGCLSTDGGTRIALGGGWGVSLCSPELSKRLGAFRSEEDGEVSVWSTAGGRLLARFVTRGYNAAVALHPAGLALGAGDNAGRVYLLSLEGVETPTPFITAARLFCIATGEWEPNVTARCVWCGNRFTPAPSILDEIRSRYAEFGLSPGESPSHQLPPETWDRETLQSSCPGCGKRLRFNPFIVDNRDRY